MKPIICLHVGVAYLFLLAAGQPLAATHSPYKQILSEVVDGVLVNYDKASERRKDLKAYLQEVASAKTHNWTPNAKLAFYINAYNALVLEAVLQHKRPQSVLKVSGFFEKVKYKVAGELLTLNALEEKKIRSFNDPRIHFAVNCGSKDCPPLAPFEYDADKLQDQLEKQTRLFLARKGEVQVKDEQKTIEVSMLFKWYEKDWGSRAKVLSFISKYRSDLKQKLDDPSFKLVYREYNWNLNQKK